MLLSATARRRPSLWSSSVASSASARALAMIIRPSPSVRRIGSVTALMMLDRSPRSRCSACSESSSRARATSAASRGPSTRPSHRASRAMIALGGATRSSPAGRSRGCSGASGMACTSRRPRGVTLDGAPFVSSTTGPAASSARVSGWARSSRSTLNRSTRALGSPRLATGVSRGPSPPCATRHSAARTFARRCSQASARWAHCAGFGAMSSASSNSRRAEPPAFGRRVLAPVVRADGIG
jgi:hypothetical protein